MRVLARHPAYTGKIIVTLRLTGTPALVSLRPGAVTAAEHPRAARVEKAEPAMDPATARVRVTDVSQGGGAKLDLGEAPVIVSGGRGLRGPENFKLRRGPGRRVRQRGGRRDAGRDRRRLAAGDGPDRPDRPAGEPRPLHRARHLGRDPASGGDAHREDDRGDQQGQGRADLQDRRLRNRGRPVRGGAAADGGGQEGAGFATSAAPCSCIRATPSVTTVSSGPNEKRT